MVVYLNNKPVYSKNSVAFTSGVYFNKLDNKLASLLK